MGSAERPDWPDLGDDPDAPNITRNERIYRMWAANIPRDEIAQRVNLSTRRVSEIIGAERGRASLAAGGRRARFIEQQNAQLDGVRAALQNIIDAPPAPVLFQGEPVVMPDGSMLADHSATIAAVRALVRVLERQARSLGTDEPVRVTTTGTVTYTLNGVELGDLK